MRGAFLEIVAAERLVNTEFRDDWDAGETRVETVLEENARETAVTTTAL